MPGGEGPIVFRWNMFSRKGRPRERVGRCLAKGPTLQTLSPGYPFPAQCLFLKSVQCLYDSPIIPICHFNHVISTFFFFFGCVPGRSAQLWGPAYRNAYFFFFFFLSRGRPPISGGVLPSTVHFFFFFFLLCSGLAIPLSGANIP